MTLTTRRVNRRDANVAENGCARQDQGAFWRRFGLTTPPWPLNEFVHAYAKRF